ncbi:putative glycogen debranching enzyme [Salinibacter ruber]|uniref:amylo-alpha-1,6-glucosidase n=1 Tax=Salinibacter ruber TaxID=146919 RepID=UPI0021684971|nr:amylo-alpha-1,6-glucosidase [Salinibacter ruber]MCS3629263.1 putative glycogen debranching enzyme [Salinibacter ruber]MCS4146171.1 putative glycogen debranching enzyme [Salinibacter ruber]
MLDFGRDSCSPLSISQAREWLVTNGLGGYASGTVGGPRTRGYHGLLVAALDPPLGRTLLVSHVDETVTVDDRDYALATHRWDDGTVAPNGVHHLDRFHLEGTVPVWTYGLGDALLEKRVWMAQDESTTYVQYRLTRARKPAPLLVKAFVTHQNHHAPSPAGDWQMAVTEIGDGLRADAFEGTMPIFLRSDGASATPEHTWYRGFHLAVEAARGLPDREDLLHAATFESTLAPGETLTLTAGTAPNADLDGTAALARRRERDDRLVAQGDFDDAPSAVQHLARAADQFVVARSTEDVPEGRSIIAGYPWFGDWGRDTMIALPGLTLAPGRPEVAEQILRTYARYVDRGMIPNRFPDDGEAPEYNTVDATLWFVEAIRAYVGTTGDTDLVRDLWPVLTSIVEWHRKGTRYGIQVDPNDGLLRAGEPGVQLTWMDAKVGGWVVTPRIGKPVEVNALWYNALRILAALAEAIDEDATLFTEQADRVAEHFSRFWGEERGYCRDVIDGPDGDDPSLRPNQIFAVSLPHSPLSDDRQRAVVDTCAAHLYTPHGLRSLAPTHPDYVGIYGGGREERDGAYHQGTVWSWLIGPFVKAHLRVYDDPATARSYLTPLLRHLNGHGVGSVSEIFDGEAPFTPRGTSAQAWGVAQLLAAWLQTEPLPHEKYERKRAPSK